MTKSSGKDVPGDRVQAGSLVLSWQTHQLGMPTISIAFEPPLLIQRPGDLIGVHPGADFCFPDLGREHKGPTLLLWIVAFVARLIVHVG